MRTGTGSPASENEYSELAEPVAATLLLSEGEDVSSMPAAAPAGQDIAKVNSSRHGRGHGPELGLVRRKNSPLLGVHMAFQRSTSSSHGTEEDAAGEGRRKKEGKRRRPAVGKVEILW